MFGSKKTKQEKTSERDRFKSCFETESVGAVRISSGKSFHSFGASYEKDLLK